MYRFYIILMFLLMSFSSAVGQGELPQRKLPSQFDDELEKKVDDYFDPLIKCGLFSGAVLIARNGKIAVHKSYGKSDFENDLAFEVNSRTKLMSVTKSITATALMTLVEEGKLNLNDRASKYLPNFPMAWDEVTLAQLLSHSSGIPNCESIWAQLAMQTGCRGIVLWPELAKKVREQELDPSPKGQSNYSNFNYVLLGLIIEQVSGKTYPNFVRDRVFVPAGMKESGFANGKMFKELAFGYFPGQQGIPQAELSDMSRIQAAGGMYSTVADLFRLDRALRGNKIMDKETREKMFEQQTSSFACGWTILPVHGHRCLSHSGGNNGYVADFLRFPNDNACVIVTSNLAFSPITMISRDLAGILFENGFERVIVPDRTELEKLEGVFTIDGDTDRRVIVRSNTKTLTVFDFNLRDSVSFGRLLIPRKGGVFAAPIGGARYKFNVDPDSEKTGLTIVQGKVESTTKRQNKSPNIWKSMNGTFDTGFGTTVTVSKQNDKGTIHFANPGQYPAALTFIPLSENRGFAIRSEVFGTFVNLMPVGDSPEKVGSFTWQNVDGSSREFTRSKLLPGKLGTQKK